MHTRPTRPVYLSVTLAMSAVALLASEAAAELRVFTTVDGQQAQAPTSGPVTIDVEPGSTLNLASFMEDTGAGGNCIPGTPGNCLNGYQLIYPDLAAPVGAASGSVTYININPGVPGGDTVFTDVTRPDWVFASNPIALPVSYNETPALNIFGLLYNTIGNVFDIDPGGLGLLYMVEFQLAVADDACGQFEFQFKLPPDSPPLSSLFNPNGGSFNVDEWQPLIINVINCGDPCKGVDCSELDDECVLGVCNPDTGACVAQPLDDGTECDDGEPCTQNDACNAGTCSGTDLDCSELDDDCNVGVCNPDTGACVAQALDDGTECDDGEACTQNDACSAGTCSGTDVDCSELDDDCNVGVCNPDTGACVAQALDDGTECDDGAACTQNDACSAGTCSGTDVDCSELDDQCNVGVCNPDTGACVAQPLDDGTKCDDGEACTRNDACNAGTCSGTDLDCSELDDDCNVGVCNPDTGECQADALADGTPCNDDLGVCSNGVCIPDTACTDDEDCADLDDQCVMGVCNLDSGRCEAQPLDDGTKCDDEDACTEEDVCNRGLCSGTPLDCSDLDEQCVVGVCNPDNGLCETEPLQDGSTCDDGDPCTAEDACSNGTCVGADVDCSDLDDDCIVGVCNPDSAGCEAQPLDDGTPCAQGLGNCLAGECIIEVVCRNDEECSDGLACNGAEACNLESGLCEAGQPVQCGAGEVCSEPDGECVPLDCNRTMYVLGGAPPAPYNPASDGILSVVLTGDEDFEVADIVLPSLRLQRCDGGAESAKPILEPGQHPIMSVDLRRPYDGTFDCADGGYTCDRTADSSPDGIRDLKLPFDKANVFAALNLQEFSRGDIVVLELRGVTRQGQPFCARECVRITAKRERTRRPPWRNEF